MFVLPPCPGKGDMERVARRPANWWHLFMEGWTFLSENRQWDSDDRELVSRATGLHQLSPSEWANGEPDTWWKAVAKEYARSRSLNLPLTSAAAHLSHE